VTWSQAGLPTDSLVADRVWVCTVDEYRFGQFDTWPEVVTRRVDPSDGSTRLMNSRLWAAGVRTGYGAREAAAGCCEWTGRLGQVQATLAIASRSIVSTTVPRM
jgi:hypothetical protein